MATVYLAQDLKHQRRVAIKVLKPELSAVIGGARFLAEIRTTANLQHPHILPLHDSGEVDGSVFYVMPYVEGESLRDRLQREKQLPIDDAVRIAREVAGALHYAHGHGVIHRDIKPENILLHDGHALVADFGIALAASSTAGTRMTETGMSLGTPTYMSPEQAMGEREITARSDVYALGCVLYEMLLGEPPFTGPTAQSIVAKVLSERPAPMRGRRDRVPPAVEAAVLTALEKLPADRFGTLAEFAAALTAPVLATGPGVAAGPIGRKGPDRRLVFVAGLVAGGAIASAVFLTRAPGAVVTTRASTQLTFNGRSIRPAISPDGEFVAFVEQKCALESEVTCPQSLVVQGVVNSRPVEVLRGVTGMSAPRWTADGQSLVVVARLDSVRRGLYVVPRLGGVPRPLGEAGVFDTHASADSVVVVRSDPRTGEQVARVVSIATGEVGDSAALGKRDVSEIGWSPDGNRLAVVAEYSTLTLIGRNGVAVDSARGAFRQAVRWTPDGEGVMVFRALAVKEDDLERFPVDGAGRLGTPTVLMPKVSAILLGQFDVARRTGRVVLVSGVITIDLWTFDVGDATTARQRTTGTTWYGNPAIAPDGRRLYYLRGDEVGDNLYTLVLPDEEEALRADPYPGGFFDVAVSRDHRRLVFGYSSPSGIILREVDIATRASRTMPWGQRSGAASPHFAGARSLVYLRQGRLVTLDSLNGTETVIDTPDTVSLAPMLATSPDGALVAVVVVSPGSVILGVTPIGEWRFRALHRFEGGMVPRALSWTNDGTIFVTTVRAADEPPQLWRVREDPAGVTLVMSLPAACVGGTVAIAAAQPRAACKRVDSRGDVWLADLPGIVP